MKVVIDIPDQMYQKIKETNMVISGRRSGRTFDYILFNAVNTGTPLPKGHGRLIDADALALTWHESFMGGMSISSGMINDFHDAPTIIEADKAQESEE